MKAIIIDDEDMVREAILLLGHWSEHGIDPVLEADNACQAIQMIETENPDIIITDMKMPIMDGKELLVALDEKKINCKVIVVSGFSDYNFTRQAIRSNVIDYILKPVDEQELNEALSRAVSKIDEERQPRFPVEMQGEEPQSDLIFKIEKYIRENFCKDIRLNDLAAMFYVSKEHISRSFKKQYKINLFDYITSLRIEKAKMLLCTTKLAVEEIAAMTGFSNGNYFSKTFRKLTGCSPREFKNQATENISPVKHAEKSE